MNTKQLHKCEYDMPSDYYGPAIGQCLEKDGCFWVYSEEEYANIVNYCPFCGVKAPVQVPLRFEVRKLIR